MTLTAGLVDRGRTGLELNGKHHQLALRLFMALVAAHLVEHAVQAIQIWGLRWHRSDSRGAVGHAVPWLASSEILHYAYALAMLVGILALRRAFTSNARIAWNVALVIQLFHHFEHLLLLVQRWTGAWFGKPVPTSLVQLIVPRVELHLIYNTIVLVPMVAAMILHKRWRPSSPGRVQRVQPPCTCWVPRAAG